VEKIQLKGEITYEMKDMAYCYRILEVPTDFFSLSADITKWLSEVESCKVVIYGKPISVHYGIYIF
jgi:ATP-dependent DNA helicase Q4